MLAPIPEPVADYLLCEALGFRILPWQLDEIEVDVLSYWSQVIGTYREERGKQEWYRDKDAASDAKRRRGRH